MEPITLSPPHPTLVRDAAHIRDSLTELIRTIQYRDRDRACCYDLSVSQCHALQSLVGSGPMTVNQLAAQLRLEKSTASRLAKSLIQKDLVRKRAPRSDGRVVILQVTEAGHRMSRRILNDLTEEYMELLEEFDPVVRSAIPRVLDRITQVLTARCEPAGPTCC